METQSQTTPVSVTRTGIRFGLLTVAVLIIYFAIMALAGLIDRPVLRYLNYVFLFLGIYLAMNSARNRAHVGRLPYLKGLGIGFWVVGTAAIVFGVFVGFYASTVPDFLQEIERRVPYGSFLNPTMAGMMVFAETAIFGVVLTFILMQFFKRNEPDISEEEEKEIEHPGTDPSANRAF